MKNIDLRKFENCKIGQNVSIRADNVRILSGACIGDNVRIEASKVSIGYDSRIEKETVARGLGVSMGAFQLGDNALIGFNNQILTPYFEMLDYSQLHNSCLCSGYKPITIGYNCWIGQSSILNCFEDLTIGNNVRTGSCQIWTHVASGELLEGCNFNNYAPVVIEDNVWLMGFGQLVAPGIVIKRNSIIMAGTVVTKSTEPFKTYSGAPMRDVTEKLNGWRKVTIEEKMNLLKGFIGEFIEQYPEYEKKVVIRRYEELTNYSDKYLSKEDAHLIFVDSIRDLNQFVDGGSTFFDLTTKRYTKKRSIIEISWMKFAVGHRARFVPMQPDDSN